MTLPSGGPLDGQQPTGKPPVGGVKEGVRGGVDGDAARRPRKLCWKGRQPTSR